MFPRGSCSKHLRTFLLHILLLLFLKEKSEHNLFINRNPLEIQIPPQKKAKRNAPVIIKDDKGISKVEVPWPELTLAALAQQITV